MLRAALETWLYRLFLKLCMPIEWQIVDMELIFSPLNLTAFIRLCIHLHSIGYPSHWIDGVLDNILSDNITTKARPPRTYPLKIREVKNELSPLKQSIAPFVAELSTLVSMWQCALPFGILAPTLPRLDQIRKYTLVIDKFEDEVIGSPVFVISLFNADALPPAPSIRPYLLTDELAETSIPAARRMKGIHIISTWTWDSPIRTASFWLREDILEIGDTMWQDRWAVALWMTDNWFFQSPPQRLEDIQDTGLTWAKEIE